MAWNGLTLLHYLVPERVKRSSTWENKIKVFRPRIVFPPLLFQLQLQWDHTFGTNLPINESNRLGFSISYLEVVMLKGRLVLISTLKTHW